MIIGVTKPHMDDNTKSQPNLYLFIEMLAFFFATN